MRRFFFLLSLGVIVWWIVNCIVGIFFAHMPPEQLKWVIVGLIVLFAAGAALLFSR